MDPILGNKVIVVAMRWRNNLIEMDHFWEPQNITVGTGDRNKYPLDFDFLPEKLNLVEKKGDNLYINFLDEFDGQMIFDKERISLTDLKNRPRDLSSSADRIHQYRFEKSTRARLNLEDISFDIRFVARPDKLKQFEQKFDKIFIFFILFSLLFLIGFGSILSLFIKDKSTSPDDELALLSERMVELIINPPTPKKISKQIEKKAQELTQKRQEKVSEKAEEKNLPGQELVRKGDGGAGGLGPKQKFPKNIARLKAGGTATEAPHQPSGGVLGMFSGGSGVGLKSMFTTKGPAVGNIARNIGQNTGGPGGGSGKGGLLGYKDGLVTGVMEGNTSDIATVDGGGIPGQPWGNAHGVYMNGRRKKSDFSVKIEEDLAEIVGGLTKEQIRKVIEKHISEIRYCYESQLQRFPNLSGKVTVNFMISFNGKILWTKKKESSMRNAEVDNCIVSRVNRWGFPQAANGGNTEVVYPFLLNRLGNF